MAAAPSSGRLVGLFKQGWNVIPEVVGSSVVALLGVGLATVGLVQYYAKDGDNRRFKSTIVVLRPDDPLAAKIRKD